MAAGCFKNGPRKMALVDKRSPVWNFGRTQACPGVNFIKLLFFSMRPNKFLESSSSLVLCLHVRLEPFRCLTPGLTNEHQTRLIVLARDKPYGLFGLFICDEEKKVL